MDGLESRMEGTDEGINEMCKTLEITQSKQQRKNRKNERGKGKQRLRDPWDYKKKILFSHDNSPRGREKEARAEKELENIMAEKFLNLTKDINLQTLAEQIG